MRKLDKFLRKLSPKEREAAIGLIESVLSRKWNTLNIKKLGGFDNLYRVRKGDLRIVYYFDNDQVILRSIGWKNDTTYNL